MPNNIRKMANTKNTATPVATARISTKFGMEGTCPARTCKSGSEMVITNPMTKVTSILGGIGAIVKQSNNTIASMGKTAFKVSVSFSLSFDCVNRKNIKRLSL